MLASRQRAGGDRPLCAPPIIELQDPLGQMGLRLENSSAAPQQRWAKQLADGSVAVALYNRNGGNSTAPWVEQMHAQQDRSSTFHCPPPAGARAGT